MFLDNNNNDFDFVEWTDDKTFGRSLQGYKINAIAPLVVAAGITAAAGIFSSLGSSGGSDYPKPKVLPETVSGNVQQSLDFLFDVEATESMKEFSDQLTEWGEADRSFFDTQFQPFQQDLIKTNQSLLPLIERNSTEALNQNVKDLLGSENLKSTFRQNVLNMGSDIGSLAANFAQQIDSIPTEDQRIGEAVSGLEQAFGQAGAELKRKMNAKGLGVTEASQRDLAISKATAKAGVTGVASEAARREKLQATTEGVGVLSNVQGAQTNQLLAAQASTQAGANLLPQVGGVQDLQAASKATEIASGLVTEQGSRITGQTTAAKSAEFTQKGVQVPKFFSGETGNVVTASGEDVRSLELTHAEALAAALKKQKDQFDLQTRTAGVQGMNTGGPGAGAAAPGPVGGGPSSPGPAGSSGDTGVG